MALSPTTNIASLVARRNLSDNGTNASRSINKVSQGTRIARASDDAAGLAISKQMKQNLRAMNQGLQNATQGASLLQVAAGGLDQTANILTRMKQLSVQVINNTLGASELAYINEEFGQLMDQIEQTAEQTRFNGKSILLDEGRDIGGEASVPTMSARGSKIISGFNTPEYDNANQVNIPPSPAFDYRINTGVTSGVIVHDFPEAAGDIEITVEGQNLYMTIGNEVFRGDTSLTANSTYILTSMNNPANRIGLYTSGDVSTASTPSEVTTSLQNAFAGASIRIGIGYNALKVAGEESFQAQGFSIQHFNFDVPVAHPNNFRGAEPYRFPGEEVTGLINWEHSSGTVQGRIRNATVVDAVSGAAERFDFSLEVGGRVDQNGDVVGAETFQALDVGPQDNGVLQLVSTSNPENVFALNFGDDVFTTSTGIPTTTLDTGWLRQGFEDLFAVGAVTPTWIMDVNIGTAASSTELGVPASGVSPFDTDSISVRSSRGYIDGTVRDVTVESVGGDTFDVQVQVGEQTFSAYGYSPTATLHELRLVDNTNNSNVIALNVRENAPGIFTGPESMEAHLEILLGLDPAGDIGPVRFQSGSSANHLKNGVDMTSHTLFTSTAMTEAGKYIFNYDAETSTFSLSNGKNTWTETFNPEQDYSGQGATSVQFQNGLKVSLGQNIKNQFNHNVSISQMAIEVAESDANKYDMQIAEVAGEEIRIAMTTISHDSLGLSGTTLNGKAAAREAQYAIDAALQTVNLGIAHIGAAQSRLEYSSTLLKDKVDGAQIVRGTFIDVDMAAEISDFTKFQVLTQASTSMLSQANQLPGNLIRLIP